jgi:hypothetical protein
MPRTADPTLCQFNVRTSKILKARLDVEAKESRRSLQDITISALEVYLDALQRQRERQARVIAAGEEALAPTQEPARCDHCDEPAISGYSTCDRHSPPAHRQIAADREAVAS